MLSILNVCGDIINMGCYIKKSSIKPFDSVFMGFDHVTK